MTEATTTGSAVSAAARHPDADTALSPDEAMAAPLSADAAVTAPPAVSRAAGSTLAELAALSPPARRLLAATDELFFRQGAVATTVREITAACGLSPAALYNHFSSKDELLYWLVMYRHRLLAAALDDALATADPDPVSQLRTVVEVYVQVHMQANARRGARVANREFRSLGGAQLAEVVSIRRQLRDRVRQILAEGADLGVFSICGGNDPGSVTVAAATILDMCIQAAEWLRDDGDLDLQQLQARYVAMALRLVGADST